MRQPSTPACKDSQQILKQALREQILVCHQLDSLLCLIMQNMGQARQCQQHSLLDVKDLAI